jgi:hypothetical protein
MEAFLEKIAASVTKEHLPELYRDCYIFPTKRAAIYFSDFLQKRFEDENFILPETITIQEFIIQYSPYIIKEDWELLLQLHQIQNAITDITQPLEKFLPWGKMILKDFDECDKYLVNVVQLFSLLKAQKELDDSFTLSEEMRQYIEQFILTTATKEGGKENIFKSAFVKTWSLLGEIYSAFHQKLGEKNEAYEGMAYRGVYEALHSGKLILPYDKIVFCGFNALSVCEEKIFLTIEKNYSTEFWWDDDEHFIQNKLHEAGNFLRQYRIKFPGENSHWVSSSELSHDKKIQVTGISSDIGQTAYVSQHMEMNEGETTAIVLCNEHLLHPLLYMLDASNTNITMGYPIVQSELYLLSNLLFDFYANARVEDGKADYYHADISALLQHAYLKKLIHEPGKLKKIIPYFLPYMPEDILSEYFPASLLQTYSSPAQILSTVIHFVTSLPKRDAHFDAIRDAVITQLKDLRQLLKEKNVEVSRNALPFIVKQFISQIKVPFETNTKSNIQIMGFLETRILDFDNLFILSLNDDNLPGTNKTNSFIPYNLRKGFGLPTFEQFDGINAYHFYRLLKRAKNIHLLYNNQVSDNASEKSRFIRQIQHDLATKQNKVSECIAVLDEKNHGNNDEILLRVKKTDPMIAMLRERKFSPSALKVYIQCPLQFYLRYVAGVDEPEEFAEEIDAAVFGQILHKVLELIYKPFLHTSLDAARIKAFTQEYFLREKIKEACKELQLPKEIMQGSNKLQLKIIERIAQKILHNDASITPLFVINTEEKFIWDKLKLEDGSFATIQGTFDRIDKISASAVRIIDYKTGQIELPKFPEMESDSAINSFLDSLFIYDKKDMSAAFQGLLYALMYYKLHDCREIYVGYHHAKKMKEGISYLNEQRTVPLELLLRFEMRLSQLVSAIIYKDEFFIQSENENAYKYSAYADLLGIS